MLIPFQPFVYPVLDGLRDDGEIAIAEVEKQLFERTAHLNPRMPPTDDAIDAFLVCHVLDDVAGMF